MQSTFNEESDIRMDFQALQYPIDKVIQRVRTARLALPDFQREFVWNPARVVELLDSVARQWPIGSLLLLNGPQPFAVRPIDCGPRLGADDLDQYILDGQQRVTALYHAIADVSPFCYFVNFNVLAEGGSDYISWEKRERFERTYGNVESRAGAKLALVKDIWDLEAFYSWLEHVGSSFEKVELVNMRERRLSGLQARVYKLMAIELDQEIELEALARIFETLNRTGVRLNAFDLMVAALYPSGFNLRGEWEEAKERHSELRDLEPDAIEVLKLIGLLIRVDKGIAASKGVRQGDLLEIDRAEIKRIWPAAVETYARSIDICRRNFGVITQDVVPSWSMILGVAAWIVSGRTADGLLATWWYSRLFSQFFSQAANTRVVADFERIVRGETYVDMTVEGALQSLNEPARANGLMMRGLGAMLVKNGARDIVSGEPLSSCRRLAFRAITVSNTIRRVASADTLGAIVVVADETDRTLGREYSWESPVWNFDGLESQGIDPITLQRGPDFFTTLFQKQFYGGGDEV